jgi:hypothetical protein
VPDIGETTTFLLRPGGSETDQSTGPPEAESVIVPVEDGVTSRVAGRTLSVPEADVALTVADAGADVDVTAVALGDALPPVVAALTLTAPPVPLAAATSPARQLAAGPAVPGPLAVGPATMAGPLGGGGGWWGGKATTVTTDATAAAVPVSAPACAGRRCCQCALGGARGRGNPWELNADAVRARAAW